MDRAILTELLRMTDMLVLELSGWRIKQIVKSLLLYEIRRDIYKLITFLIGNETLKLKNSQMCTNGPFFTYLQNSECLLGI